MSSDHQPVSRRAAVRVDDLLEKTLRRVARALVLEVQRPACRRGVGVVEIHLRDRRRDGLVGVLEVRDDPGDLAGDLPQERLAAGVVPVIVEHLVPVPVHPSQRTAVGRMPQPAVGGDQAALQVLLDEVRRLAAVLRLILQRIIRRKIRRRPRSACLAVDCGAEVLRPVVLAPFVQERQERKHPRPPARLPGAARDDEIEIVLTGKHVPAEVQRPARFQRQLQALRLDQILAPRRRAVWRVGFVADLHAIGAGQRRRLRRRWRTWRRRTTRRRRRTRTLRTTAPTITWASTWGLRSSSRITHRCTPFIPAAPHAAGS